MSQSAAAATRAIARPARRIAPARPQLQLVTPVAGRRNNLPFVLLCSVVLSAGLLAVLWLNMLLSQGAYELHALEEKSALYADQEAAARAELAATSSAGQLARRAGELGLVPAGSPIFLQLPDGKVLGVAPKEPVKDPLKVVGDRDVARTPAATPGATAPSAGATAQAPVPNGLPTTRQGR